ncbi:hypothetical protein [Nonomuraea turcica]|uniref:hypothetical protein n=1 Tax=Nonomuraea sp. G32 TaxID=3067274 RepID=UPI00273A9393|nr:hypothetical protein [Nonomuraea sp. G32]MDP4502794.1 hypothetical protein [Nonomuraea sp. G32]
MSARFGLRSCALFATSATTVVAIACTAAHADSDTEEKILLKGSTTASYYWDDGSGRNGDTGMPASGKPMQKGLAASPSWPLLTEGYVVYKGKKLPFFVGDRGPGVPSNRGIMLDLDAKTFAELTGGRFNPNTLSVDGVGGQGHIKIDYVITKWGDGVGKKNYPVPFSTGAWGRKDTNPAKPPKVVTEEEPAEVKTPETKSAEVEPAEEPAGGKAVAAPVGHPVTPKTEAEESSTVSGVLLTGALAMAGGGVVLGHKRLRRLIKR